MLFLGTGLLHVGTEFLKLEQVGMRLYMSQHNFCSSNGTLSVETDSFQSWEITLKVGTGCNRNLKVGSQMIDDGRGSWNMLETRLYNIGKDSGTSKRMEQIAILWE